MKSKDVPVGSIWYRHDRPNPMLRYYEATQYPLTDGWVPMRNLITGDEGFYMRFTNDKENERIPTQEEMMTEESKQLLKQGIDLVKVKVALKEILQSVIISDKLTGENRHIAIHWSIHAPLVNWLRAEFPGMRFTSWPWGNWWTVRVSKWDPTAELNDVENHQMVIK